MTITRFTRTRTVRKTVTRGLFSRDGLERQRTAENVSIAAADSDLAGSFEARHLCARCPSAAKPVSHAGASNVRFCCMRRKTTTIKREKTTTIFRTVSSKRTATIRGQAYFGWFLIGMPRNESRAPFLIRMPLNYR